MLSLIFSILLLGLVGIMALRSWSSPGIAMSLVIAMYALEQVLQPNIPILLEYSWLLNVAIALIALLGVLGNFYRGGFRNFIVSRPLVWYLLLLGLAVVSHFWAPNPEESRQKLRDAAPYLVAFSAIAPWCVLNTKQLSTAFHWTLILGFVILIMLSVTEMGTRGVIVRQIQGEKLEANPLAASSYGGMVGICAVFSIYVARTNKLQTIVKLLMIAIASYVIVRSGSRGQLVALAGAVFVWLPVTAKVAVNRSSILAVMVALALVVGGYFLVVQLDTGGRFELGHMRDAQEGRFAMCSKLLDEYINSSAFYWLFGLGNSSSFEIVGFYPHVVPVEVLCEEGLVGLILFLLFFGTVFYKGLSFMRKENIEPDTRVNLGILMAMLTFEFILCLKQGSLIGFPLMFCIGLIAAQVIRRLETLERSKLVQSYSTRQGIRGMEPIRPASSS